MRLLISILISFISISAFTQKTDTYVDPRDGQSYRIHLVDSIWWFSDNLKFETAGSHCPNVSTKDCSEANFYPYTELDEVCPDGWHVSTLKEWEAYIEHRKEVTGVDSLTVDLYPDENAGEGFVALTDYSKNLQMFSDDALLNFTNIGWVEGKKRQRLKTITIWGIHPTIDNDRKYHIHIGPNSYVGHRHDHHIIDKPRRVRKFAVRCVKD